MRTAIGLFLAANLAAGGYAALADDARGPGPGPCGGMNGPGPCGGAMRGRGSGARGTRLYDPKTVTTVSGEVAGVQEVTGRRGGGIHLDLKTASGASHVHVGPAWFLQEEGMALAAGDRVEITGSQVTLDGQPTLIAQVVKKGDKAVALRDLNGVPVWAGCGRR